MAITGWLALKDDRTLVDAAQVKHWAIVFVVALTVTYSITYTSIQYFSSDNYAGNSDALLYMAFAEGENVGSRRSKSSRVLTIQLVKLLPDPPSAIFHRDRAVTDEWILKIKFAAVNSAFLVGAALLLWYYLRRLRFSIPESYLGMLLFLTSVAVVYSSTIPMVEASSFFFITLCAVAIVNRNLPLFALGLLIGLFAKESVAFVIPLALLAVAERRLWCGWGQRCRA